MGALIKIPRVTSETSYDSTEIYRRTGGSGSGSLIKTMSFGDYAYYDSSGAANYEYRYRYKDSANTLYSGYSDWTSPSLISTYTDPRRVYEAFGFYSEVYAEAVGTGDSVTAEWSLDERKIVEGTDRIYVDGVLQTRDTHYNIDVDAGTITFTAGNIPGAVAITADYWWSDVASSVVTDYISRAEDEINRKSGRKFYGNTTTTEYYDGDATNDSNYYTYLSSTYLEQIKDYLPDDNEYYQNRVLMLKNRPVSGITTLTIGDDTLTSSDYDLIEDSGIIILKTSGGYVFTRGVQNITVTYTYGYSQIPYIVEELATNLASYRIMRTRVFSDTAQNLSINAQNLKSVKEDIENGFDTLGRKLSVTRL